MNEQKSVSYVSENSYTTRNQLTSKTKYIWLVFHGMGYLSTYFSKHFKTLDTQQNYIIIPQAPSKYYQGTNFKHVGACWLTRVDTEKETENVLTYIDAVMAKEGPIAPQQLIVLGYSQGVSIAMRWMASRKIQCKHLILHSGGIPKEQTKEDFNYLMEATKVSYIYGDKDEYITEAKKTEQLLKGSKLFGNKLSVTVFKGVHKVNESFIKEISEKQ